MEGVWTYINVQRYVEWTHSMRMFHLSMHVKQIPNIVMSHVRKWTMRFFKTGARRFGILHGVHNPSYHRSWSTMQVLNARKSLQSIHIIAILFTTTLVYATRERALRDEIEKLRNVAKQWHAHQLLFTSWPTFDFMWPSYLPTNDFSID